MKPLLLPWKGEKEMKVLMEDGVELIDEVVVTGYQRIRKNEMIGSANTVKSEDLFYDGHQSIEQMLQGKLVGTSVLNTSGLVGTAQKVRVRGTSTLLGNQEPVWVVDGIIQEDPLPFKPRDLDALGSISQDNFDMIKNFVGNSISWLSPNDIMTISVLKDAAATVMYGVKAANGVIIITTKQGKAGRISVNYSGGMTVAPRIYYSKMNLMNSSERVDVSEEIYRRGLVSEANRPLERIGYEGLLGQYLRKEISYAQFQQEVEKVRMNNTDWFKELFRHSVSHNHSVSLSGGTDRFKYYASINSSFTNGISVGNDAKNYSASVSIDTRLSDKINLGVRLNAASNKTNGFFRVDPYQYASTINRAIPAYNEDGSLFYYAKSQDANRRMYNILHEMDCTGNTNTTNSVALSANLRWTILQGLQFEGLFGYNLSNVVGSSFADEQSFFISNLRGYEFGLYEPGELEYKKSRLPHGGELNTTENRNTNYTLRGTLSYNKIFGDVHRMSLMAGSEIRSNKYDGYNTTLYGYFPNRGKSIIFPPRQVIDPLDASRWIENDLYHQFNNTIIDRKINTVGMFATGMYSFDERYIFSASIRSDASNRFGQDERNRFLPVWSAGARWNIINEPWIKDIRWISDFPRFVRVARQCSKQLWPRFDCRIRTWARLY
jgi:TonB-linked SusC/RagA family outer membrane protein